ncbi:hypothetical protein GCM10017624_03450 [Azotobacter vinelandii]|nr:hypothetical protein GCM10017624_03450 [Azotobacter vinelandii]
MDIFTKVLTIFVLSLAAAFVVGGVIKLLGKDPNWPTMLAIALGMPIGHLISDLLSLGETMLYVAIGGCTAIFSAVLDLTSKRCFAARD